MLARFTLTARYRGIAQAEPSENRSVRWQTFQKLPRGKESQMATHAKCLARWLIDCPKIVVAVKYFCLDGHAGRQANSARDMPAGCVACVGSGLLLAGPIGRVRYGLTVAHTWEESSLRECQDG